MRTTTVQCDRCGEKVFGNVGTCQFAGFGANKTLDLCLRCFTASLVTLQPPDQSAHREGERPDERPEPEPHDDGGSSDVNDVPEDADPEP